MSKNVLDELIENNEFPIIFIGSGISKRFLDNSPSWIDLLEECWKKAGKNNFFGELSKLKSEIKKINPNYNEFEVQHEVNINIAQIIEDEFDRKFYDNELKIDGFSSKEAYQTEITPFKKFLANKFNRINLKEDMKQEYDIFKKMLIKSQIILTTNYDEFIEKSYKEASNFQLKKYIGQKGFFEDCENYSEIYKIHGCITNPRSIVITKEDYDRFQRNSVLISAKIISMLMNSPIIFMGYSLTDINIRNIIGEFTKSLDNKELLRFEDRIILVEYDEEIDYIEEEKIKDVDLGCSLRVVKTNNFHEIFTQISKINQGIAPAEVRKYKHVMKKLIVDRGKKGVLNSVLISPEDIDGIEKKMQSQNIAIAIGDSKYIFQIPDNISFMLDYITDRDEISNETRLRYAHMQNGNARFPCNKFLTLDIINESQLHETEKEKLRNRIEKLTNFNIQYNSINKSSVFQIDSINLKEISEASQKKSKIYETISFNIKSLNQDEVKKYLIEELEELKSRGEIKPSTEFRRLLLIYDIYNNKEDSP
ncbi:hypothetical protein HMPREF2799_05975 [Staphylococcus sp. HMSC057A02]|nr:hypothetical protein HMPREF2799_05975 [Staphylococcus sp. HMSC057A02]